MTIDRLWQIVRLRIRTLLRRAHVDDELADELRDHVERQVERLVTAGRTPEDARTLALRSLGGLESVKEQCRDQRGVRPIETFTRDVRHGLRLLRRNPGFAAVAIASLALGIGANAAIFQLLDAVRLRPLPVEAAGDLAILRIHNRGWPPNNYAGRFTDLTYAQWQRLASSQEAFTGTLAVGSLTVDLSARGESRFAENSLYVSGNFFNVLGIPAARGRVFTIADDVPGCGTPGVVVSDQFWKRALGQSPSVVGSTLTINGHPIEVIGITPPGFFGVEVGRAFDLALPLCTAEVFDGHRGRFEGRGTWWLSAMGRLKPGWSLERATAHLRGLSPPLFAETLPADFSADDTAKYRAFTLTSLPGASGYSQLRDQYDTPLWLLLALAGMVLLIACSNLANLLLARMGARAREMAVRLALGASRGRLVRQLLAESLLLAALGAAAGIWLAPIFGRAMVATIASEVDPLFVDLAFDWRIILFTATLAAVTCVTFGLAPAIRGTRTAPSDAMKGGARGSTTGPAASTLRRVLVVSQVALSLVLVIGGLLFGRSLVNLLTVDTGFQQAGIVQADVDFTRLGTTPESLTQIRGDLLARLRALPDIEAAAIASNVPLVGNWYRHVFVNRSGTEAKLMTRLNRVSADYFATMNIPVQAGRDFDARDTPSSTPVAIVNDAFARQGLDGQIPIGITVRLEGAGGLPGPAVQIVGVVGNAKYSSLREDFGPLVYLADTQNAKPGGFASILLRTRSPIADVRPAVADVIDATHARVAFHFHDFREQLRDSLRQDQLMALLCGCFAALGAVLATIGVYGLCTYSVAQRMNEIGIRVALGADRRAIVSLILCEITVLLGISIVVGLSVAIAGARVADTMLFGLTPRDPPTLAAAAFGLAAVGLAASYLPARRAARLDPVRALHLD